MDYESYITKTKERKLTDEDLEKLYAPEHIQGWIDTLIQKKRDVDSQISMRRAQLGSLKQDCLAMGSRSKSKFFKEKSDYDFWRATALRFKSHLEHALSEAKRARTEQTQVEPSHKERLWDLCHRAAAILEDVCQLEDVELDGEEVEDWLVDYRDFCVDVAKKKGGHRESEAA